MLSSSRSSLRSFSTSLFLSPLSRVASFSCPNFPRVPCLPLWALLRIVFAEQFVCRPAKRMRLRSLCGLLNRPHKNNRVLWFVLFCCSSRTQGRVQPDFPAQEISLPAAINVLPSCSLSLSRFFIHFLFFISIQLWFNSRQRIQEHPTSGNTRVHLLSVCGCLTNKRGRRLLLKRGKEANGATREQSLIVKNYSTS